MAFFGRYNEVTPHSRLVWTNDEGGEDGAVTAVTFEERGADTVVVIQDLYPSKEALDDAIACGSTSWNSETFEKLDELLVTLGGGHSNVTLDVGRRSIDAWAKAKSTILRSRMAVRQERNSFRS